MIGASRRYRELLIELLLERELAGGRLPPSIESRRAEELDRCWWAMTSEEQEAIEREHRAGALVGAPAALDVEDVVVDVEHPGLPRKVAA